MEFGVRKTHVKGTGTAGGGGPEDPPPPLYISPSLSYFIPALVSFFFFFFLLATHLSSLTRDWTRAMAVKVRNSNH